MPEETPNPYAAPQSTVTPPRSPRRGPGKSALASPWTRLVAAIIDGFIMALCFIPFLFLVSTEYWMSEDPNIFAIGPEDLFLVGAGYLVFIAVNGYLLVTRGQSIGKAIMSVRIVDMDGSATPAERILGVRYLFYHAFNLFAPLSLLDILFIFRSDHRCIHDLLGGTQVVQAN